MATINKNLLDKEFALSNDGKPSTSLNDKKISTGVVADSPSASHAGKRRGKRSMNMALRAAVSDVPTAVTVNTSRPNDRCFFCGQSGHRKAQCSEWMAVKDIIIRNDVDISSIPDRVADIIVGFLEPLNDYMINYVNADHHTNDAYYLWQSCEYVKKVLTGLSHRVQCDKIIVEKAALGAVESTNLVSVGKGKIKDVYIRDLTKDGDVESNPGFDMPDLAEIRAQFSSFMTVANLIRQSTKGVTSSVLIGSIDILVASLTGMRNILSQSPRHNSNRRDLPRIRQANNPRLCQNCWQRALDQDGDVELNPGPFNLMKKGKGRISDTSKASISNGAHWVRKNAKGNDEDTQDMDMMSKSIEKMKVEDANVTTTSNDVCVSVKSESSEMSASDKIDLLNDEIAALRKKLGQSKSNTIISQLTDKAKRREKKKLASICHDAEKVGAENPNIPVVPSVIQKEVTVIPHFGHSMIQCCDVSRVPDKMRKHIARLDSFDDCITKYLLKLLNLSSVMNNGDRLVLLLGGDIELNPGPDKEKDMTGWWTPILRNPTASDSSDLEGIAKSVLSGTAIGSGILGLGLLAAGAKSGVIPMAKFGTIASILAPMLLHMSGPIEPSTVIEFMDQNKMIPEDLPLDVKDVAGKIADFTGDVAEMVPFKVISDATKKIWDVISGGPGYIVDHVYKSLMFDVARSCARLENIISPDHFVKVWNRSTSSAQLDIYADHYVNRTVPVNSYGSKYLFFAPEVGEQESSLLSLKMPIWIAHDTGVPSVGSLNGVDTDLTYKRTPSIVEGEYMWTAMTDTIRKELGSGIDLSNVAGGSNSGNPLQELIRLTMSMLQQNNEMFRSGPIYGHTNAPFRAIMRMLQYGVFYDFQNGLMQGMWDQPSLLTGRLDWQDLVFPMSGDMMTNASVKIYATCCSIEKYIAFRTGSPSYTQVAGHNAVFVANPSGFIMDRFKEGDEWAPIFSCADMSAEDRAEAVVNELEYPFRIGFNKDSDYWNTTDGSGLMELADDTLNLNGHQNTFDLPQRIFIPGVRGRDLGSTRAACVVFVVPTYASIQYSSAISVGNLIITDAAWTDVTQVVSNQAMGRYWASATAGSVVNEREMGDVIFSTVKRFAQFGYYSPSSIDAALRFGAECCRAYMPLNEVSVRSGAHGAAAVVRGGLITDDPNGLNGVLWDRRWSDGCTGSNDTAAIAPAVTYHDCLTLASFEMPHVVTYTDEQDMRTVAPNFIIPSSCFWPIMMSVVGAMVPIGKMNKEGHDDLTKSNTLYGTLTSSWHAIAWMNIFSQYVAMFSDLIVEKMGITRNLMWEPLPGTHIGRKIRNVLLFRLNELHWMLGSGKSVFQIEDLRHVSTSTFNSWDLAGYDEGDPEYLPFNTVTYGRIPKIKMLRDLNVIDAGKALGFDILRKYLGLPPATALINAPFWQSFAWSKGIKTRRRLDPDGLVSIEYWKASEYEDIHWDDPMNKTELQISSIIQPSYGHFLPAKETIFFGGGQPSTTSRGIIAFYEHDNSVFWHPTMNFVRWDLVTIQSAIDELLGSSESLYDGTFLAAMTGSTWFVIPANDENAFYILTPYFNAETGITNDENGVSFVEFCQLQKTFEDAVPDKFMATENRRTIYTHSAWSSFRLPGESSPGEKIEH